MLSLVFHITYCELWRVTGRYYFKTLVVVYGTKNKQIERQIVLTFIRNGATHKPIKIVKMGSGKSFFAFHQFLFNI